MYTKPNHLQNPLKMKQAKMKDNNIILNSMFPDKNLIALNYSLLGKKLEAMSLISSRHFCRVSPNLLAHVLGFELKEETAKFIPLLRGL